MLYEQLSDDHTPDSSTWVFDTSRLPSAEDIVHAEIRGDSESPIIVKLLKYRNKVSWIPILPESTSGH